VVLFVFEVILGKLSSHTVRTVEARVRGRRESVGNLVATAEQSVRPERGQRASKANQILPYPHIHCVRN
jgi:hypothetical protein